MSAWQEALRALFVVPTGGMSEVVGRKNQLGRTVTGGLEGGAGGFLTGGPIGAGMGAATGAGLSGTGTTDPYKLKGGGINFGSGVGAGGLTHIPAMMASSSSGPAAPGAAAEPSKISMALQAMRGMPMGGQQQAQQGNTLDNIYKMYPGLKPGNPMGFRSGGM